MLAGIGRDQDLDAHVNDLVDLLFMPVASVRERDRGCVAHTDLLEFAPGGRDHRLELPKVRRAERDLGRQHDLLLVHDSLHVVTLGIAARRLHIA